VTISDADERLHPIDDPSPHWSDSLYFNAWDPDTNTFLITRMAVLGNQGRATAGMLVWIDGVPAYAYGHELDAVPPSDWDVMPIGGMWLGSSGVVDYSDNAEPLPRAVAWGHYEQSCAVLGDLVLGDRRIRFDGTGQRDHSWGYRHWAGLHQWHWVTGFLHPEMTFNLFEVRQHDGTTTVNGFAHDWGDDRFVVAAERTTVTDDNGSPTGIHLTLTLADGTTQTVTGELAGMPVPVRPAPDQPVVVHEAPMRFEWQGASGFGIYEHLVSQFD
jgi:hypothetical protein